MSKPLLDIMNLNLNRYGTTFNIESFRETLFEEINEMFDGLANNDTHEAIDGCMDSIVVLAGLATKLGYNPELCLKQTVREISSRKQQPEQAAEWQANPKLVGTTKWLKDTSQPANELYQADYSTCRLKQK